MEVNVHWKKEMFESFLTSLPTSGKVAFLMSHSNSPNFIFYLPFTFKMSSKFEPWLRARVWIQNKRRRKRIRLAHVPPLSAEYTVDPVQVRSEFLPGFIGELKFTTLDPAPELVAGVLVIKGCSSAYNWNQCLPVYLAAAADSRPLCQHCNIPTDSIWMVSLFMHFKCFSLYFFVYQ